MAIIKWVVLETHTLLRIKSTSTLIKEMRVSSRFYVSNTSFAFYQKTSESTSIAVNVEQTPRINRKVKHPSTNIKEGHSGQKTISMASLQACSEIHLSSQTGRAFTM